MWTLCAGGGGNKGLKIMRFLCIAEFVHNNLDARRSVGSHAANGRGRRGQREKRERGAELVSVCVCGAGAEEECHGYSVSGIRKENSIIKLSSASARIYFASHLRVSRVV